VITSTKCRSFKKLKTEKFQKRMFGMILRKSCPPALLKPKRKQKRRRSSERKQRSATCPKQGSELISVKSRPRSTKLCKKMRVNTQRKKWIKTSEKQIEWCLTRDKKLKSSLNDQIKTTRRPSERQLSLGLIKEISSPRPKFLSFPRRA
jgi:hypothetical protein